MNYSSYLTLMSRALFGWSAPVMVCLRTTLSPSLRYQSFARVRKILMKSFYPRAEAIVTISKGSKRDLLKLIPLPEEKVHVIYNPVDVGAIRAVVGGAVAFEQSGGPVIVAVGRLTAAKDYPTLLRAFRAVANASGAHLTILGEGEERQALERLSRDLGLEDRVTFMGFVPDPWRWVSRAEMLVLSSAWEGFGNVILEAMACGTPVVATDCPSGPGEIITDGESGLLVPVGDHVRLAEAVMRLLGDRDLREKLARGGTRRVEDFRVQKVTLEYESLMFEVAGGT
jgi:glycosyltransferase involved in cell wall biosynthesis